MSEAETEHRSAFDAALKALALLDPEIAGDWGQRQIMVPDGFRRKRDPDHLLPFLI